MNLIKSILDYFNYKKKCEELEQLNKNYLIKICNMRKRIEYKYHIIYNPLGSDGVHHIAPNIVYIQGKPSDLIGIFGRSVTVVNDNYVDELWFQKAIKPLSGEIIRK